MRESALQVLKFYAEGGTIMSAIKSAGISQREFYLTKRENPDISVAYAEIKRDRADMASEEAYGVTEEIGTGLEKDEKRARVRGDLLLKIAAMYDPQKFGNRLNVELDAGPNILGAMAEAALRLPPRDLGNIIDVKPLQICDTATDTQSGASPGSDDPFAD